MLQTRFRRWRALLSVLLVPAFAVCGTDTDKPVDDTATPDGATSEGGDVVQDAALADASVDALSDAGASVDANDAASDSDSADAVADAPPDSDANVEPLVLSYLAYCYQGAAGGLAVVYGIDDRTGALLRVDQDAADAGTQDFPAGQNTIFSAVSPARGALYCARSIAAGINPSVGAFSLSDAGVLSARTSGAIAEQPVSVAVHPSGNAIYALGNGVASDGIYSFPVAANGGLSAGAYAGWAEFAQQLVVDRLGRFVFAGGGGTLWVHQTNPSDAGALTLAPFHLKDGGGFQSFYVGNIGTAKRWAVHPALDVLYGLFGQSDKLVAFAYSATTGVPNKLNESAADDTPAGLVVHPNGNHAYAVHAGSATIGHYSLASDGSISARTAIAIASAATVVTMDPTGKYLYAGTATALRGYAVSATGALTPLALSPVSGVFPADLPTIAKP